MRSPLGSLLGCALLLAVAATCTPTPGFSEWGEPELVVDLNGQVIEGDGKHAPVVSPNGLELYFSAAPKAGAEADIWVSTRTQTTDLWPPAVPVETSAAAPSSALPGATKINTGAQEGPPTLSADGLQMYFSRTGSCGAGTTRDISGRCVTGGKLGRAG